MSKYRCIVAGSLGVGGRALLDELKSRNEWDVFALSRRKPDFSSRANFISVDLGNLDDTKSAAKEMNGATHIFFAAYSPQPTLAEEVGPNLSMLKNLVTSVESTSPQLRHVAIVQGSKWYGNHLGPYKTPAKEDDPRHMPPNFYYDQQDWIEAYQKGKQWNWSSWRPHGFCGTSVGSAMNQLTGLAIYATISRELGLPLRFPGSPAAFKAVYQFTDASLLARALLWGSENPACANQGFNLTNGEYERWENIWPAIAECFAMRPGPVQTISLSRFMADKEPLWARICEKHDLKPYRIQDLVKWDFVDWVYSASFDQMSSLSKVRRAGWNETLDAESMFRRLFGKLRSERIIP